MVTITSFMVAYIEKGTFNDVYLKQTESSFDVSKLDTPIEMP